MEKYEGPILEYDDGEGGGDLIQPMCCNTAVVGGVYAAVVAWDAVGAVNWAGYLNGIIPFLNIINFNFHNGYKRLAIS